MPEPVAPHDPPRYEIKIQCRAAAFDTLRFLLQTHEMALHAPYPPRLVQSIYFDTADGRAARENLTGQATRAKLRFRWYGTAGAEVRGALELKRRDNALVNKERAALEPVRIAGETRRTFMEALRRQAPPRWRWRLEEGQEPAQWIQYERHYFAARHCPVRVTVDRNLRAWDLRDTFVLRPLAPIPMPDCVVVECKAPPEHHDEVQSVADCLPAARTRCSKYLMACLPHLYAF